MNAEPKDLDAMLTLIESKASLAVEQTAKRRRVRMTDQLILQLAVIKVAEGGTSTDFCEMAIAEAAARRVRHLRKKFSGDTWERIVQIARESQLRHK